MGRIRMFQRAVFFLRKNKHIQDSLGNFIARNPDKADI